MTKLWFFKIYWPSNTRMASAPTAFWMLWSNEFEAIFLLELSIKAAEESFQFKTVNVSERTGVYVGKKGFSVFSQRKKAQNWPEINSKTWRTEILQCSNILKWLNGGQPMKQHDFNFGGNFLKFCYSEILPICFTFVIKFTKF